MKKNELGSACSTYEEEEDGDNMEDLHIGGRIILKRMLTKYGEVQTGLLWLWIGTGGTLL